MSEKNTGSSVIEIDVQQANSLFMGGANAGEILTRRSPVIAFNTGDDEIRQFSYEFHVDRSDIGDLGFARGMAAEFDFVILEKDSHKNEASIDYSSFPTWRTYSTDKNGLYVGRKSGVLYEHHRGTPENRDLILVTKDKEIADAIFDEISGVSDYSKGRNVFSIFSKYWDKDELL